MLIGELARRTALSVRTLRFYESAGVLPTPARRTSGYRDYDDAAVGRLAFVKGAQAAGLTLRDIRRIIEVREQVGPPCEHVAALLDARAAELDQRMVDLVALRKDLKRLRARAASVDPRTCSAGTVCDVIPLPG